MKQIGKKVVMTREEYFELTNGIFVNKEFEGIYYTRFIAAWLNEGGNINFIFKDWLKSLTINGKKMPDIVIHEIYDLATNGKLELEMSAKEHLRPEKEKNRKNNLKMLEDILNEKTDD